MSLPYLQELGYLRNLSTLSKSTETLGSTHYTHTHLYEETSVRTKNRYDNRDVNKDFNIGVSRDVSKDVNSDVSISVIIDGSKYVTGGVNIDVRRYVLRYVSADAIKNDSADGREGF